MIDRPTPPSQDHDALLGWATDSILHHVRGLVLGRDVHDAVLRHLTAALPHEGVGLLATTWANEQACFEDAGSPSRPTQSSPKGLVRAMKFYPGCNVDASPTRFTMDPAEVLVALREIDERGWWLGAIVHSHPYGPAHPSPTDLREARYPDALAVIVSLAEQPARLRAWRLPPGGRGPDGAEPITGVPVWIEGEASARVS